MIHLLCVTKELVYVCNFQLKTLMFLKKETQKEHTFTVDGLISGWAYIQNNIFV